MTAKLIYQKIGLDGGMTAKISPDYISLKPKPRMHGGKNMEFVFLKSKPEIVELVAKQMLEAVE